MERKSHEEKIRKQQTDHNEALRQRVAEDEFMSKKESEQNTREAVHKRELNTIQLQFLQSLNKDMNVGIYFTYHHILDCVIHDKVPGLSIPTGRQSCQNSV